MKTEWGKYGDVLDALQKRIRQTSENLEQAKVGAPAIGSKLRRGR